MAWGCPRRHVVRSGWLLRRPDPARAIKPEDGQPGGAGAGLGNVQPLLGNLSKASAVPVLSALRQIHRGYIEADRMMGSICITGPIQLQMPVVERACEVTRGADRAEMLRFACQFTEFAAFSSAERVFA